MRVIFNGLFLEEIDKTNRVYKANFRVATGGGEAIFGLLIEIIGSMMFRLALNKNNKEKYEIIKFNAFDNESLAKEIREKFDEPIRTLLTELVAIIASLVSRRQSSPGFEVNYDHPAGIIFMVILDLEDYSIYDLFRQAIR